MKTIWWFVLLVLCVIASPLLAHAQATTEPDSPTAPTLGPLQGKWEDIDQRFVFLTVDLASTEASLSAVNKVLALAGNEQAKQEQREEGYINGNTQMDRNGGGPVSWQDFYGQTARSFYFHSSTVIRGRSRYTSVSVRETSTPTPISRPPQFDYIYRANADAAKRAEADVAKLGNKMDQLIRRRQQLEEEQSALWRKIALRALTTRELGDKPMYRFEATTVFPDSTHQQALLAIGAGAKFMRTVNALVIDSQKALDGDQGSVYLRLAERVANSRAELKAVLLAQPALAASLVDENTPLGQFALAAKRLEDSSQNLTEAYKLAMDGDKSGDFQRKLSFRGQMQMMTMDFSATVMTADDALDATAEQWKILPDNKKPVAAETAAVNLPGNPLVTKEANATARTVNLIPLIDVTKNAVRGTWKLDHGAILSDNSQYARLRIPYEPPDEYDFHVQFVRNSGNECVSQMFRNFERSCMWNMGGDGNTICGFTLIDGLDSKDKNNPSRFEGQAILQNGHKYDSLIQVRKGSVTASIDGTVVSKCSVDPSKFSNWEGWSVGSDGLGIGSYESPTTFSVIEVVEIKGSDEQTRQENSSEMKSFPGWYHIVNKGNRRYLWITSDNKNRGNPAGLGPDGDSDNEQWAIHSIPGSDAVMLVSKYSNRIIGVRAESKTPGMDVLQWNEWNPDAVDDKPAGNKWKVEPVGDSFKIVNELSGQCLTYKKKGNPDAIQEPSNNSDDELWQIESVK